MTRSDSDRLLRQAQSGNRDALESLLVAHRAQVFRYGLRVCRTSEDAEDAVQETLWAAARSIHGFRRAAAITTWLFVIVRNVCLRMLRHERFYVDLDQVIPSLAYDASAVWDEAVAAELRARLAAALARLSPLHREVILLRDVQGFTAPEAAAALDVEVQALKSRLHRAREQLRQELCDDATALALVRA